MFARATGRGYTHFLGSYIRKLPLLSEEEKEDLVIRLRNGEAVHTQIMNAFLRLILQVAAKYEHHNKDELVSAAIDGLIDAIHKFPDRASKREAEGEPKKNNIKPYLVQWVKKSIQVFIAEQRLVPIPANTLSNGKSKAKLPIVRGGDTLMLGVGEVREEHQERLEVKEIIELIIDDDIDRKIVEYRLEEKTDKEISVLIGYSQSFVVKRRAKLQAKLSIYLHRRD